MGQTVAPRLHTMTEVVACLRRLVVDDILTSHREPVFFDPGSPLLIKRSIPPHRKRSKPSFSLQMSIACPPRGFTVRKMNHPYFSFQKKVR